MPTNFNTKKISDPFPSRIKRALKLMLDGCQQVDNLATHVGANVPSWRYNPCVDAQVSMGQRQSFLMENPLRSCIIT
jgi:hypothetical protein